jgi:hypothetical protein
MKQKQKRNETKRNKKDIGLKKARIRFSLLKKKLIAYTAISPI